MNQNTIRIIIADDDPISQVNLKRILLKKGYTVIAVVSDGFDAVESCRCHHPDLVIMDIDLPLLDGFSVAKIVNKEDLADAVMILSECGEWKYIEQAKQYGVSGYLMKPADEKSLIPGVELAVARSKEIKRLRKDIATVSNQLETRTIIDKAKGQIMVERHMTDEEAFSYMKNISQSKNLPMRRVAEILLVKTEE